MSQLGGMDSGNKLLGQKEGSEEKGRNMHLRKGGEKGASEI